MYGLWYLIVQEVEEYNSIVTGAYFKICACVCVVADLDSKTTCGLVILRSSINNLCGQDLRLFWA